MNALAPIWDLLQQAGPVVWAILAASVLMWTLILERYWFLLVVWPRRHGELVADWLAGRSGLAKALVRRQRATLIADQRGSLFVGLNLIRVLTALLPLLGLLGTVLGMIDTFTVLAESGRGDVRGVSAGISQALFSTMAGLVTALSGYSFSVNLRHRAVEQSHRLELELK